MSRVSRNIEENIDRDRIKSALDSLRYHADDYWARLAWDAVNCASKSNMDTEMKAVLAEVVRDLYEMAIDGQ